jgi:hypothetical protein
METEQINIIILLGVYMFVIGGLLWRMTKPKINTKKKRNKRGSKWSLRD